MHRIEQGRLSVAYILIAVLVVARASVQNAFAQPCPTSPTPKTDSPVVPPDVCIPANLDGNPIAFFDDFSWRAFVAMVWPAQSNQRGVADTSKSLSSPGPRVFESFKAEWELFRATGAEPSSWNEIDQQSPCGPGPISPEDFVLASFTKFGNLGQAGFGDLIHALPTQTGTWVRYATGLNRLEYDDIVARKLYLRANLEQAGTVTFKDGSLDVKSSWVDMAGIPRPERYYTRTAQVQDPVTSECSSKVVGLVGLHIVVKTPSRPQWIWSTFEHVDNVKAGSPGVTPTFNDGSGAAMPASDPNGGFPPDNWAAPKRYNVQRLKPIDGSTQQTNAAYRAAVTGVWKNYELVMTQWPLQLDPTKPIPASQSGKPAFTFPGTGATTSFSNTTLETWDQKSVNTGCMACHTATQKETDFLWVLSTRAFSPPAAVERALPAPVQELKKLLRDEQ